MTDYSKLSLYPAAIEDLSCAMAMIQDAKDFHKAIGLDQWNDDYPAVSDIEADINAGKAYFLCDDGCKVAYLCLDLDGEAIYNELEGHWLTDTNATYLVIHRLAMDGKQRGKGYSSAVFSLADQFCREHEVGSIRVDTHAENEIMQHLIRKAGFVYCGIVYYNGSPRTAFEKIVK